MAISFTKAVDRIEQRLQGRWISPGKGRRRVVNPEDYEQFMADQLPKTEQFLDDVGKLLKKARAKMRRKQRGQEKTLAQLKPSLYDELGRKMREISGAKRALAAERIGPFFDDEMEFALADLMNLLARAGLTESQIPNHLQSAFCEALELIRSEELEHV